MEAIVGRIGGYLVKIPGDGTDIFGDRPFVVVEDANEFLRRVGDVVHALKRNPVGEGGIAKDADHVLI